MGINSPGRCTFVCIFKDKLVGSFKLLCVLLLLLVASIPGILTRNLIYNGGFEEGLDAWRWMPQFYDTGNNIYALSNVEQKISPEIKRSGHNSLEILNRQEKGPRRYGALFQQIKIWPNAKYNVSLYVKGMLNEESLWLTISGNWEKESGRHIFRQGVYKEWTRLGPFPVVADDAYHAFFTIISDSPGHYYLDDVRITLDPWDTLTKWLTKVNLSKFVNPVMVACFLGPLGLILKIALENLSVINAWLLNSWDFFYEFLRLVSSTERKFPALWLITAFVAIFLLCWGIWKAFDVFYSEKPTANPKNRRKTKTEIRIARYEQTYDEITRYRNLSWQILAFAWAIYYGLNWTLTVCGLLFKLPPYFFLISVYITAIFATIFLLYCEHSANRNRAVRRQLETVLGLDEGLRFKAEREGLRSPGFWISVWIFLFFIWSPPLAMILFRG